MQEGRRLGRQSGTRKQRKTHRQYRWSLRFTVWVTASCSVIAVVLISGFAYATYVTLGGHAWKAAAPDTTTPSSSANGGTPVTPFQSSSSTVNNADGKGATPVTRHIELLALGDSLAHGLGDASGNGFVGDVRNLYKSTGYQVTTSNLGIDGLTSRGLLKELSQQNVRHLVKTANVILISIGGNDLSNGAGLPHIKPRKISLAEARFQSNLKAVLKQVRGVNPSARIVMIGLYNPFNNVKSTLSETNSVVMRWNLLEQQIATPFGVSVIPTFDLFQIHAANYLYLDHFHPNQAGYSRIASRIWQDLLS